MSEAATMDTPAVSVVIPAYNRAKYVVEAVESVMQQEHTHPGHEVIVVDDGSSDETSEVLAPFGSRIRYVFQENAGQGAARNHGLRLARGEWVLFLDSDDALLPGALSGMLACVAGRAEIGAVQGGWRIVSDGGETLSEPEPWRQAPQLDLDTWVMNTPLFLGGMLCRRSWAERVGGFDTQLRQVEDVDFVLRLALLGCEFGWLRRPVVQYRQHGANITQNAIEEAHAMEQVYGALFERPELPDRIRHKKDEVFYYRYAWFAWRLCRTGCREEVEAKLRRSLACSAHSPQKTVLQWARLFVKWSRDVGTSSEDLSALLPHMREVVPLDEEWWRDMVQVLPWWAAVWSHYLAGHEALLREAWAPHQRLSTSELLAMAQQSLLITPVEEMEWAIGRFLEDERSLPLEPALQAADVVSLYLTAFGQAAMAHRPRSAVRALSRALLHSGHPRAIGAWARFAANAFSYATSNAKRAVGTRP